MNTKIVSCPHCFGELNTPASLEGQEVQCPLCQKNFVIKFAIEEYSEKQQTKNTFQPINIKESKIKLVEKPTNSFQGDKTKFLTIALVILILLLMIGNGLLLFSMQTNQENMQNVEREIKATSENLSEKLSYLANPVYEYKVVTVESTLSNKYEASITADSLHKILTKHSNWELVDAVTEIATEHPNFGNSQYVTGLQPDVRTQQIKLILRRKKQQ